MNDRLVKQFLLAALMCGARIPSANNEQSPDPLQVFLESIPSSPLFQDVADLGYIRATSEDETYFIVTDKGKEFLK